MYPAISTYFNTRNYKKIIDNYQEIAKKYEAESSKKILAEANEYNKTLLERKNQFKLDKDQEKKYTSLLNLDGNGYIGYIEIPAINVNIPINHGLDENVIDKSVGHLKWSSLPVGGESTHAVLSTHNGLVSNRLFTDLWKWKTGDKFIMHVLNERLIDEVDKIKRDIPEEKEDLYIEEGKDQVTLITCTPYGINSHRLLVRGHRIKDNKEFASFASNGIMKNKYIEAGILSIIPLCLFIAISAIGNRKRETNKKDK